jgi:glycosyltransferase involved in cell wall biosynthesis
MARIAYLFERFPSFTQTFCYREVSEMYSQGVKPLIYSIRTPEDAPADCPRELLRAVRYLPLGAAIENDVKSARSKDRGTLEAKRVISKWGRKPDKLRAYEAAWLGPVLLKEGVRHVHAHFAGMAARTAYWLKQFYGISFSFTGHANDMFASTEFPVQLEELVTEASRVIVVSDFTLDWLQQRFPACAEKMHRIYNGLDLSLYPPAAPGEGKPRVLSVGRYIEKKGFADLIDACAILRQRGIEFECLIVGGGPLEEALKERIRQHALEGTVSLTGPKPQEEVRQLLSGARLFGLACATEQGGGMDVLPTVIIEAMACALPVVSTRVAGVPEMVEDGVNGFLTGQKDPAALARAMEAILTDREKSKQFGARGRTIAEERFDSKVTCAQLAALLEKCGTDSPPAPQCAQGIAAALGHLAGRIRAGMPGKW